MYLAGPPVSEASCNFSHFLGTEETPGRRLSWSWSSAWSALAAPTGRHRDQSQLRHGRGHQPGAAGGGGGGQPRDTETQTLGDYYFVIRQL